MKKTILITLFGASLALVGCAQQPPAENQNVNQPAVNVNQNTNQPVVNVNQNVNTPPTTGNQNVNINQNTNTNQAVTGNYFANTAYGYSFNLFNFGYQALSNSYGITDATTAASISIRKDSEPLDTYQGQTFKPSLDVDVSKKDNRTLSEIAEANYELSKNEGYTKGSISTITIGGVPAKQFTVAGGFKNESGYKMAQEIFVIYLVKGDNLFQITVPANHMVLNQIMYSLEFTK